MVTVSGGAKADGEERKGISGHKEAIRRTSLTALAKKSDEGTGWSSTNAEGLPPWKERGANPKEMSVRKNGRVYVWEGVALRFVRSASGGGGYPWGQKASRGKSKENPD